MRIIAGSARGRQLKTRKGMETRPTADRVKESLFNIIRSRLTDAYFLDMFAGNGGVGIEALSRGAQKCVFIEKNNQCVRIIKANLLLCGLENAGEVWQSDAVAAVNSLKDQKFDLIFLDPPYHSPALEPLIERIFSYKLLATDGLVIVEHHQDDRDWYDKGKWGLVREKKYGDTVLTFLMPSSVSA